MNGKFIDWPTTQSRNVRRLQEAERNGRLDFVLYGDSISSWHYGYTITKRHPASSALWKKYFGNMNAVPLAIPGDQIGQVLWRLRYGKEKPTKDPRVIGLLIGINDCIRYGEDKSIRRVPTSKRRMNVLLQWTHANMPGSGVILFGLTPTTRTDLLACRLNLNKAYKQFSLSFAQKGMRIKYVECAANITRADGTPTAPGYLSDAVHLTATGHNVVLRTMRKTVDSFVKLLEPS